MNTIDELIMMDERIFSAIELRLNEVEELMKSDEDSVRYLTWRFVLKIGGIKESIKLLFKEGDPYSARILARSEIDHYFKLLYICLRSSIEKNDSVAEEYLTYCDLSEYLEYHKPLNKNNSVEKKNKKILGIYCYK